MMSVEKALQSFKSLQARGEITAWVKIPAKPGSFTDLPDNLCSPLSAALKQRGARRLYSHQAEAFDLSQRNQNTVVVTPTASGKTLCYNLPVLEDLLRNPQHRALYLFPTKALAQDQLAELRELIAAIGAPIGVQTYDGDTPADQRRKIRLEARIILTNPDMLHSAILPHHPKWIHLFQNLRYVVLDELHTYRGIFGSHVANVFRRLRRLTRFYKASPQFICTSATIANPGELAQRLVGEEVQLVQRNGSPAASKELILYNPPLVNPELGLRRSAPASARRFAEIFLKQGLQCLVFATSRVKVEVLLSYLKKAIEQQPELGPKIRGYRGGYLPQTRREIERQMRNREILGIVSTNALELGIDIGSLEVCVLAGYPGFIASAWQQIGRVGRRGAHSAAVLVARNLPLDQFVAHHPEYFLEGAPEHGRIHPDNLQILVSHIQCAAFELPFEKGEMFGSENLEEILNFLTEEGGLLKTGDRWHWTEESYPANSVNLRNIPEENFIVFNIEAGSRAIAEVDFDSAPELLHEEALYLCEGRQFHVDRLDYSGRKAYVRPVQVDYYTEAITYAGLRVLRVETAADSGTGVSEHGEVHLVKKVPGFKKIRFYTSENLGYGKVELPVNELHTTAYWLRADVDKLDTDLSRDEIIRGFLGLAYALHHMATFILMCDIRDLGRSVGDRSASWFVQASTEALGFYSSGGEESDLSVESFPSFQPTVFLYDNYPGGVGFSEKLFECHDFLTQKTRDRIVECSCRHGCPSCVGPVDELGKETKQLSLTVLELLLGAGRQLVH